MTLPRTFENDVCSFETENTENRLGNSKYFVGTDRVIRFAYINFGQGRPADQTVEQHPSICYLDETSGLYQAIMATRDDSNITVSSADDVNIRIRVDGYPDDQHYYTGNASRIPAEGLCVFDFINDAGTLSEIHVGHAVTKLVRGPWSESALAFAMARLTFVGLDSGKLTMRGNQAFLKG